MTPSIRSGDPVAARLDPRGKLAFQAAFALAAFAHTTPRGLALLSALVGGVLLTARLSPVAAASEYRFVLPFLVAGPLLEALRLEPPWIAPAAAVGPLLASYRVVLVLLVSAAYVRTTPVRESRAAVQHLIPGRAGRFLGVGVGFVFRFLPVLRADLRRIRGAVAARAGDRRPLTQRVRIVGTAGLARALSRADRFALALRARCFAWNPTLPPLAFSYRDAPVLVASVCLTVWVLV